jgi:AcrR family transcriptional regulator
VDGRRAGERAGLTREAVVAAAAQLVADEGLDGLTMRSLAERLAVHPNSLYSHVASKAALLEALVDDMLRAVPSPEESGDWQNDLRSIMVHTYDVLLDHPDLVTLVLGRGSRGPEATRLGEAMHRLLRRGGIYGDRADRAVQVLIVYAIGAAAFAASPGFGDDPPAERTTRMRANFEAGLSLLLEGLASEGSTRSPRRGRPPARS